jgi:acyl transferase domain-containing protein
MLSATGKCSSFDSKADGYARSEGCGVVIVKRLSDAIKDNNTIHAVIKSIAINQNGDAASLVAPNINAQIAVHRSALERAELSAADIDYIEAHGTGTKIGDAVEFNAMRLIFFDFCNDLFKLTELTRYPTIIFKGVIRCHRVNILFKIIQGKLISKIVYFD